MGRGPASITIGVLTMDYRVIQEFKLKGDPPSQEQLDRLREKLAEAAPAAESDIELGVGRMRVLLTFEEAEAELAIERAQRAASGVFGGSAVHVQVEPARPV
jgi:hypothetical protein